MPSQLFIGSVHGIFTISSLIFFYVFYRVKNCFNFDVKIKVHFNNSFFLHDNINKKKTLNITTAFNLVENVLLQGDQLNMAVFFWYLVKMTLVYATVLNSLHGTSHVFQGTRIARPCLIGLPVCKNIYQVSQDPLDSTVQF